MKAPIFERLLEVSDTGHHRRVLAAQSAADPSALRILLLAWDLHLYSPSSAQVREVGHTDWREAFERRPGHSFDSQDQIASRFVMSNPRILGIFDRSA